MSYTNESINKVFREIVNDIIGISEFAIRANQSAPSPSEPYCTVHVLSNIMRGRASTTIESIDGDDTNINSTTESFNHLNISFNFLRDGALDNAQTVYVRLSRQSSKDTMRENEIGLMTRSDIRDLSREMNGKIEERSQFDISINVVKRDDHEVLPTILSATINGEVNGDDVIIVIEEDET